MADREKVIGSLEVRIISDTDAGYSTIEIPVNEAERILALLKEQETANLYKCPNCGTWVFAENVIRCKDCEYFRDTKNVYNGEPFGTCTNCRTSMTGYALHSFEWFCADGKRKEGR